MKTRNQTNVDVINPFWIKETHNQVWKKYVKIGLKWSKLALYLFLSVVGLWGCFQNFFQYEVDTSTTLGEGLEAGFSYGTTNDWRFDLQSSLGTGGKGYYSLDGFTWSYGPFYAIFVWPASRLVLYLMLGMKGLPGGMNTLFSILILLFIIKAITIVISLRATLQSEKMAEIQTRIAEINAKYKNLNDSLSKQRKQMEIMTVYKKNNVRPFAMVEQIFVTLPIFLIVYRIVAITRPIKATILFNFWDLGEQPFNMIFKNLSDGGWAYIIFLAIIIPVQIVQNKLPQWLGKRRNRNRSIMSQQTKDQLRKSQMTQLIFMIMICVFTVISPAGVGLYFFLNALFGIGQSYLLHYFIIKRRKSKKVRIEDIGIL